MRTVRRQGAGYEGGIKLPSRGAGSRQGRVETSSKGEDWKVCRGRFSDRGEFWGTVRKGRGLQLGVKEGIEKHGEVKEGKDERRGLGFSGALPVVRRGGERARRG